MPVLACVAVFNGRTKLIKEVTGDILLSKADLLAHGIAANDQSQKVSVGRTGRHGSHAAASAHQAGTRRATIPSAPASAPAVISDKRFCAAQGFPLPHSARRA